MHRLSLLSGLTALLSVVAFVAAAQTAEPAPQEAGESDPAAATEARRARVYARVGDATVTVGDIEDAINKQSPFLRARYRDRAKLRELADSLVRFELMAAAAEREGYGDHPAVVRAVQQDIVQELIRVEIDARITRESISDEDVRAYYESHREEFSRPEMVRASHILLDSREAAEALLPQAREADARTFRQLVRQHSIDTETKLRGGDLRYFDREGRAAGAREDDPPVDPALVEAAFALTEVGAVSPEPVQVGEHWSIVKLTGRRPAEVRTLEQVADGIRLRLWRERRQQAVEELVRRLRQENPPEIHEERARAIRLDPLPAASSLPRPGAHPNLPGKRPQSGR